MAKIKAIPKSYHPSDSEINAYRYCIKNLKVYYSIESAPSGFYIVRGTLDDNLHANKDFIYKRIDITKPDRKSNRLTLDKVSAEKEIFRSYLELFNIKNK